MQTLQTIQMETMEIQSQICQELVLIIHFNYFIINNYFMMDLVTVLSLLLLIGFQMNVSCSSLAPSRT